MTPKQKEQFNRMRAALRKIAYDYMTPAQIQREEGTGLDYQEYLEMAYENIKTKAKAACRGVKGIN